MIIQPLFSQVLGDKWLLSLQLLALAVPVSIVPQQYNLVINLEHSGFALLATSTKSEQFVFDSRLGS